MGDEGVHVVHASNPCGHYIHTGMREYESCALPFHAYLVTERVENNVAGGRDGVREGLRGERQFVGETVWMARGGERGRGCFGSRRISEPFIPTLPSSSALQSEVGHPEH